MSRRRGVGDAKRESVSDVSPRVERRSYCVGRTCARTGPRGQVIARMSRPRSLLGPGRQLLRLHASRWTLDSSSARSKSFWIRCRGLRSTGSESIGGAVRDRHQFLCEVGVEQPLRQVASTRAATPGREWLAGVAVLVHRGLVGGAQGDG